MLCGQFVVLILQSVLCSVMCEVCIFLACRVQYVVCSVLNVVCHVQYVTISL